MKQIYRLMLLVLCFVGACTASKQPEPTQTRQEKQQQEKETLQKEMRNQ